jgi:hypothetical protein
MSEEPTEYGGIIMESLDPVTPDEPSAFESNLSGLEQAAIERSQTIGEKNVIISRQFIDDETGEVHEGNKTVSPEHASDELKRVRNEEEQAFLQQQAAELDQEIDRVRAEAPTVTSEEQPIEPPRSWSREQKEEFRTYPREAQEKVAFRERERETALRRGQNEVAEQRKAVEAEVAERTQHLDAATQAFATGIKNAEHIAFATLFDLHPGLRGLSAEQLPIAIQMKAKEDASIIPLVQKAANINAAAHQMRYAEQLREQARIADVSKDESAKFEKLIAAEPAEMKRAVQDEGYRVLEQYYGLDREAAHWHFPVYTAPQQKALFDLVKGHLRNERAVEGIKTNRRNPIPAVMKPGTREVEQPRSDDGRFAALQGSGPLTAKQAAALLTARRGG